MRIKVNGKYYNLREEAKDMYLELICGAIAFSTLFGLAALAAIIANTICPL